MRKLLTFLLTSAAMLLGSTLTASAAEVFLSDDGKLLDDTEYSEALEQMQKAADYTGMNLGACLDTKPPADGDPAAYAKQFYDQCFGEDTDGVFCYIDFSGEEAECTFFTSGLGQFYYADSPSHERLSEMYADMDAYLLPAGWENPAGAVEMFTVDAEYFYYFGLQEDVHVYNEEDGLYYYIQDGAIVSSDTAPEQSVEETAAEAEDETSPEDISDITNPGNAVIYDEGNRLSNEEYYECLGMLHDAADRTGMNVAVVLGVRDRSDYTIEVLADESYDELFGPGTDGLLYYMDLDGLDSPYDYISTSGMGQFYYSDGDIDNRIDKIFDDVVPYLYPVGREDIVGAIEALAYDVEYFYEEGIPDNYYLYDDEDGQYYYVENGTMHDSDFVPYVDTSELFSMMFVGIIFGLIVAVIVFFCVKARYKFKTSLSPTAYINRKNLVYNHQYDNFIRTYTTRTKIESSSGGGGGRSGGGGGRSSGGHGGGGRHR